MTSGIAPRAASAKLPSSPTVILGCIDIGSNTTRLLVAEADDGDLRELCSDRVFTCIRKSLDRDLAIPREKIGETAAVAGDQARRARELGASEVVAVATAAIRNATNRAELERAVEASAGVPLRVLSAGEEARLSFVGAARTLAEAAEAAIAVVDVGGGSTEIASGSSAGAVDWWCSLPIGSGVLADRQLRSDPPTTAEVETVRRSVDAAFAGLEPPAVGTAVAVGGTATSLLHVLAGRLDHDSLERGLELVCGAPVATMAIRLGLDPERVRVLPAGILVLQAVSDGLRRPLQVARGGLREGVILELVEGRVPGA